VQVGADGKRHLKGVTQAVDLDAFGEIVVESVGYLQKIREHQIKDIFLTVDVIIIFHYFSWGWMVSSHMKALRSL